MEGNNRYLNIPVFMLRDLYDDSKRFFDDAFDVGIYLYSKTLEGNEEKRYKDSLSFLGITQSNISNGIRNAKKILSGLPEKYPIVGIDKDMLFNYYKYNKAEFEIICLGAFLAVKSIIGKKLYNKTNKAMIHARMFGYKSPKELPETLSHLQEKLKARRQMDKILVELQLNWHLNLLWNHNRGIYVSFDLSLEKLAVIVEKDKRKSRLKELKEEKRSAIEKAKLCTT